MQFSQSLLVGLMGPFAMMMKVALADIGIEHRLFAEAILSGKTIDLSSHFPYFKTISQSAT